jgi:hypothetical protein
MGWRACTPAGGPQPAKLRDSDDELPCVTSALTDSPPRSVVGATAISDACNPELVALLPDHVIQDIASELNDMFMDTGMFA